MDYMSGVQQFTMCGYRWHSLFLSLFVYMPKTRQQSVNYMWNVGISSTNSSSHEVATHTYMKWIGSFVFHCVVKLLVYCLNYSSKALWYYLIPRSVASSVLFFNKFVFLQEQRIAVKVGTVPCLREFLRKGEREEEELAKEMQVSCFIPRMKENYINKLLLKPFELYFDVG